MSSNAFKNITFQQFETLIALVEAGSFTRAAPLLFLSQSALTKQMQGMEEAAGTKLINRGAAGISLTPEGQVLYDYAKRIARLRDEANDRVERLKNQDSGHIYVSASTTPATYILPGLLTRLQQLHPGIRVHIQMQDSDETLQMILNNQAEIGFIGKEVLNKKILSERLSKDELVLAVPPHHPLAGRPSVTVEKLTREPFVLREQGSGTRAILEASLQRHGSLHLSDFDIVCELGSTEAVKEAILAGLGVSILSVLAVKRELAQGLLARVDIINLPLERYFYIISRKNFPLRNHHRYFLEVARGYQPL